MIRLVISHTAISKSICGNLNRRRKKRGIRILVSRRWFETPPKDELAELCRGREIVGFIVMVVQ